MKRTFSIITASALAALTFASCSGGGVFSGGEVLSQGYSDNADGSTYRYSTEQVEPPSSLNGYSEYITSFSLSLLRSRFALEGENSLAFSPASTALQLCKAANGASGDTQTEILLALGSNLTLETANNCSSYFKTRMENVSRLSLEDGEEPAEYVSFKSPLFFNNISDVKSSFLNTNALYYGDDAIRFDFSGDSSAHGISEYFSNVTSDAGLKPDGTQTLFGISALEFNDKWLEPYAKDKLFKGVFRAGGKDIDAGFLLSDEHRIHTARAEGIVKYTASNPLRLFLIMPNEDISIGDYVKSLDYAEYEKLMDSMEITKTVSAAIPEFSVKSDGKAKPLSASLSKCGMYSAFTDAASYKNMSSSQGFMFNELYEISCGFSLNASGVTSAEIKSDAALAKDTAPKADITFDRPFVFLLTDNETLIPVAAGVYNP